MKLEQSLFEKARGYVIRGHELGMGLAIAVLTFTVACLVVGLVMMAPNTTKAKRDAAYQLGYDVGVFCDSDAVACSVICVNNLEQDYLVAECTRGVYNGVNSKVIFAPWKNAQGPTR